MKVKTYPKIFFKDERGKHPIKQITVYGRTYEFGYDGEDIILEEAYNSSVNNQYEQLQ